MTCGMQRMLKVLSELQMDITTDIRNAADNPKRLGELRDKLIYEYGHGVNQAEH